MRYLPFILLLPALLALQTAQAQSPDFPGRGRVPTRLPYTTSQASPQGQFPSKIVVGPAIPMSREYDGGLAVEPDSARRRHYARHKVRTIVKVRLTAQGAVQDTVEYQAVDRQGRWTQTGTSASRVRRQWSYNAQGQCTTVIEYPEPDRPCTLISTYSPGLRRGQQEALQANGTRTLISEKQLYQSADTLLTEVVAHDLAVGRYLYPAYYQRSLHLQPHPDTVLVLSGFYNAARQLTGSRADYWLYRRGQLIESGSLDQGRAAAAQHVPRPAGQPALLLSAGQALLALRRHEGLVPQHQYTYDARHQLIRQESTFSRMQGQAVSTVIRYTYNSLGQLIGREGSSSSIDSPVRTAYTVFSYLPTGLLLGETTDTRSSKPVFFRYLYQYYD